MSTGDPEAQHPIPLAARWLGYGGLVPFAGLALSYAAGGPLFPGFALQAFLVYAATILSFVGGLRWGTAVTLRTGQAVQLALAVLPALWAAGALLLAGPRAAVGTLAAGFVVFFLVDWFAPPPGWPPWMRRLRLHLSAGALAAHALLLVAL